jgi:hypothetical protein
MSTGSLLSHQSNRSVLSHQSNASVLSSQSHHALRAHQSHGDLRLRPELLTGAVFAVALAVVVRRRAGRP